MTSCSSRDTAKQKSPSLVVGFSQLGAESSWRIANTASMERAAGKFGFGLMMGEDARLNVYVVEDSLVARQLDNGRWISGYVHNGVFRKALSTPMGVALNINGERYENYFECEIPEEWRLDKLHVVAFISRPLANGASGNFTDMYVDNAEIFSINVAVGIDELGVVEDAVPVAYYDVTGRQLNGPQQGINIVKMSNGTAKKVLVK